jgi:hypothetical protein
MIAMVKSIAPVPKLWMCAVVSEHPNLYGAFLLQFFECSRIGLLLALLQNELTTCRCRNGEDCCVGYPIQNCIGKHIYVTVRLYFMIYRHLTYAGHTW